VSQTHDLGGPNLWLVSLLLFDVQGITCQAEQQTMQNKSAIISKAPIECKMSLPCPTSSLVDDLEVGMAEDQDAQDLDFLYNVLSVNIQPKRVFCSLSCVCRRTIHDRTTIKELRVSLFQRCSCVWITFVVNLMAIIKSDVFGAAKDKAFTPKLDDGGIGGGPGGGGDGSAGGGGGGGGGSGFLFWGLLMLIGFLRDNERVRNPTGKK